MKIFICDDNFTYAESVAELLRGKFPHYGFEVFREPAALIEAISERPTELAALIMDIDLGETNGIDVSEKAVRIKGDLKVIFLSAYSREYCELIYFKSLSFTPFFLVDKSGSEQKIVAAVSRLDAELNKNAEKNTLAVRTKNKTVIVPFDDILYLESAGRLVIIRTDGERLSCYSKLSELEQKLPPHFIRCHKSFVVNVKRIEAYSATEVVMSGGERLAVSRSFSKEFRERVMFIKGEIYD